MPNRAKTINLKGDFSMGDKGGKKDRDKVKKQTTKKNDDKKKAAEEKKPKQKPG